MKKGKSIGAEPTFEECCQYLYMTNAMKEFAATGTPKQVEFLQNALRCEVAQREENRQSRLLKYARFPNYKTFSGYDYKNVKLPPILTREELEAGDFIENNNNLVLYGPVGTGKTHMAIAVGINAVNKGYKTRFYTATELVLALVSARAKGTIDKLWYELNALDLLIIDEWGYVPIDRDGAQLLFRVIADSYEKKSLILTTNLEFSRWGNIFTDEQMTAAIIDRLVHHGHLILFEGTSYRMEHALMKQVSRAKV